MMPVDPQETPFAALGGQDAVDALASAFYDHMERDDDVSHVRSLHPEDLTGSREKFRKFSYRVAWRSATLHGGVRAPSASDATCAVLNR